MSDPPAAGEPANHTFLGFDRHDSGALPHRNGIICAAIVDGTFCGLAAEHPAHRVGQLPVVKLVTCPRCGHDFGVPLTPTVPRKTVAAEAEASPAAGDADAPAPMERMGRPVGTHRDLRPGLRDLPDVASDMHLRGEPGQALPVAAGDLRTSIAAALRLARLSDEPIERAIDLVVPVITAAVTEATAARDTEADRLALANGRVQHRLAEQAEAAEARITAATTCPCAPFAEQLATAWEEGRDAVYVESTDAEIVLCSGANPYGAAGGTRDTA